MQETKTVNVLNSLTRGELQGLQHFLNNPYFNKNADTKILFDFIYSFKPNFKDSGFTKFKAFSKVYPKKEFDQKQFNHLINRLNIKIDKYLAFLELNQGLIEVELKVLKYHQRKSSKYFNNQYNKVSRYLSTKKVKGVELLDAKLKTQHFLASYYSTTQPKKERNLSALLHSLDHYSNYTKLTIFCDMLNHSLIINYPYDLSVVQEFLEGHIQQEDELPALSIWRIATSTLLNVVENAPIESVDYFKFKDQLFEQKNYLDFNELRNLFIYLRTVLHRTNFDETQFYQEYFSLCQFGLELEIYFINGSLSAQSVKNILTASVRAGELDWLEGFLKKYEKQFQKKQASELKAYCFAILSFERNDYKSVIAFLNDLEFNDVFFKLGIRLLEVKTYYELKDVDKFENLINSARRMVTYYKTNNKIGEHHINAHLNFCNMVYSIYKTIKKDSKRIAKIEQELQALHLNKLPEKKWLKEKLEELR